MAPTAFFARRFIVIASLIVLGCRATAQVSCTRQTQPDSVPCGLGGSAKGKGLYDLSTNPSAASSINECRDLCVRRGSTRYYGCRMFSFNETANVCNIFSTDDKKIIKLNKTSDTVFYSRKCFKCAPQACPALPDPSVNLIDNPGFEASDTYIGPWAAGRGDDGSVRMDARPPKHPGIKSRNALHVGKDFFIDQTYRQCPGQLHRAEFDLYDVIPNFSIALTFNVGTFNGHGVSMPLTAPPSRPAKRVVTFYTPAETAGRIDFSADTFGSGGSFNYDNVVVRPVDYSSARTIGGEKVVNGGFEKGLRPWNYTATNASGKKAGIFQLVSPGLGGTQDALRWIQQKHKTVFGLNISLTPKVKNIRPGKLHRLRIQISPPLLMILSFSDGTQIFGSSTDDQYFYAEQGTFPLTIKVQNDDIYKAVFDNLSIREIEGEG